MGRSEKAAVGYVASVMQLIVQMGVQILLAPMVLYYAGQQALGAFAAINQVLMLLSLVDVVHSWTLERFLAQANTISDHGVRFKQIFTTARTLLLFTNAVFSLLVIALIYSVSWLLGLTGETAAQAQSALWVVAAWSVIRTPFAAYLNASIATQDLAPNYLIGTVLGITRAIASLAFVFFGAGLFGLMLAGTIVDVVGSISYRYRFLKLNPDLKPCWGIPDVALLKEMVGFGWKAMILNIGNVLSFNSGNAIAGISRGAEVASVYYTSQMPALTGYNILTRLPDNAAPAINQLYGQEDVIALKKSFLRLVRLVLFLSLPLSVYISIFNHDLIVTWVGDKQYGGSLLSISLGVFCFIAPIQRLFVVYSFCFNFMKELIITALVQGVGNILLAFYFSNVFGIGGIALSLVVVSIPQLLVLSSKVSSALKISMSFVVCNIMMRLVGPILLAVIATFWFHCINMFIYKSYLVTVVEAIIFLFVYIVCSYVVYFNVDERAIIKKVFRFGLR